jgi:hypothetical protein
MLMELKFLNLGFEAGDMEVVVTVVEKVASVAHINILIAYQLMESVNTLLATTTVEECKQI